MKISVDCSSDTGPLVPFWNSTGFTPATLLLTRDMSQQIMLCGSIPRGGLRYARVHYLLELVDVDFDGQNAARYDWSRLDQGLDLLIQNGMVPIFELMGNPNGQFDNFNDDLQLRRWRSLVHDLAVHVTDRYGKNEVERWYFETWNEPDIGFGWSPQWPKDEISFCNYYDACVDGLHSANPNLIMGGPGTCQTLSSLFRAFLAHCDSGINYFNKQSGTRLDFISVHEKAAQASKEDITPRTHAMIEREMDISAYIREVHPHLAKLPFMNNECDPQVGWKDYHTWHAGPYYAAWVCKSAARHLTEMVDRLGVKYSILGNDHGFIGEWGNRTLLTRFGQASWIEDGQASHTSQRGWAVRDFSTPEFAMIKKPVFNAMAMLSLLVDCDQPARRLRCDLSGNPIDPHSEVDCIATAAGDGGIAVLVALSRDQIFTSGSEQISLHFDNLPFQDAMQVHYRIDLEHSHPFALWDTSGAPPYPDSDLITAMRQVQELARLEKNSPVRISNGNHTLTFDLPLHSVSLIMLLPRPDDPPGQVTGLRAETFPGLNQQSEYLLRWDPLDSRAVQTYEIFYGTDPAGPFTRLPTPDLLCAACLIKARPGYYQVRARDYWNRTGEESKILAMHG